MTRIGDDDSDDARSASPTTIANVGDDGGAATDDVNGVSNGVAGCDGWDGDGGAIVVVAKCPIPNKSKTRLIPMLGIEGATKLAKAMLCDVLVTISKCVSTTMYLVGTVLRLCRY